MNKEMIKQYLSENPGAGRYQLSQKFGIPEHAARKIKEEYLIEQSVRANILVNKEISEKDVAEFLNNQYNLSKDKIIELLKPEKKTIKSIGDSNISSFKLGIIGDTHLNDNSCAIDELHDYYRICHEEGVEHVVHAGDLTAGGGVYKGMEYDLTYHGYTAQLESTEQNYPNIPGITTWVISGNHDLSFKQSNGAHFLSALSDKRGDIVWIGDYDATVTVNGVSVGLHHGAGNSAYSLSYKIQKYIEKIGGGQKPQIYVLGHYHATMSMLYRNIHCYLPGCFQKPNDFSVRLGLPNLIAGYIVEIKTLDDEMRSIRSIKNDLITYY